MATTPIGETLLTADEFLRLCERRILRGEPVNGVVSETLPAGGERSEIKMALASVLAGHVRPRRVGRISIGAGVLLERDPDTVREPDVAYFSAETLPRDMKVRGFHEVVPDLVVEVVSPNDRPQEIADKVAMWLSPRRSPGLGRLPETCVVAAHSQDGPTLVYTEDDELDGGDVLPGFTCPGARHPGLVISERDHSTACSRPSVVRTYNLPPA